MSGKGDDPRPLSVTQDEFRANWDAIDWGAREREAAKPVPHSLRLFNEAMQHPEYRDGLKRLQEAGVL